MLGCVNVNELDIDGAQNLKIQNIPKNLYKYRAVTINSLENLNTNTVWIDKPSKYNDVFEFNEDLNIDILYDTLNQKMIEEIISQLTNNISVPEHIKEKARLEKKPLEVIGRYALQQANYSDSKIDEVFKVMNETVRESTLQMIKDKNSMLKDSMKVCSFCDSNKELSMWSHYADSHKGICIEYNTENWFPINIRKRLLFPVIYQDEVFDATEHLINHINNDDFNNLYPFISGATKSTQYSFEREWRFIINLGEFEPQNYPMQCLNKVFLGVQISDEHKNQVLEICKTNKIDVYQTVISSTKYEIEFKLVT